VDTYPRENYRNIFDACPDPIVITRVADGKTVLVNREFEAASGYSREEALGRTSVELGLWPNPEERDRCFRVLQEQGDFRNLLMTLRMKDGTERPFLLSASAVWFSGEPCNMTVARDVTEIRRIEAALVAARNEAEAASLAKSEFLSSMSHEIRTPMNAILGMAELLGETGLDEVQRRYLALMRSNGAALLALIDDILDLARVERGRLQLEHTPFAMEALVGGVLQTFELRANEKGLELLGRFASEAGGGWIGDPLRLRQILVNLIGNAIKFTERGQVVVSVGSAADAEGLLHFAITDTGIGIRPQKFDEVFASFSQADSSTARRYGGNGLGLAIVARLVELMGGRIWVESIEGRGSTFHFTIRLERQNAIAQEAPVRAAEDNRTAPAQGSPTPYREYLQPLRILVADDSIDNRFLLKSMLKALPYQLDEVENGRQAVERVMIDRYDLVLMDVRMPVMDGLAATREIRAWERQQGHRAIPIIALTASALKEDVVECLGAGCDQHVSKPISKTSLIEAVHAATLVPTADPA
jgi:PAS domain S-box-containing protein